MMLVYVAKPTELPTAWPVWMTELPCTRSSGFS